MFGLSKIQKNGVLPANTKRVGLLAGSGEFPVLLADALRRQGLELAVAAFERGGADSLRDRAAVYEPFELREGQRVLDYLKASGIRHLVMAGSMPKRKVYTADYKPDALSQKVLKGLPLKGDAAILNAVQMVLRMNGIRLLGPAAVLPEWVASARVLTRTQPTPQQIEDARFGLRVAKEIGRLDIGQGVIVKDKTVLAVEAIEGTDRMIARLSELNAPGAVIVKCAKPKQDLRLDMPVIGERTVDLAHASACALIAVEAQRTLVLNLPVCIEKADRYGISIMGITE